LRTIPAVVEDRFLPAEDSFWARPPFAAGPGHLSIKLFPWIAHEGGDKTAKGLVRQAFSLIEAVTDVGTEKRESII